MKGAVGEHVPDRRDQRGVGHRPLRPRPAPWRRRRGRHATAAVEAGPTDAPHPADPGDTVAAARGDRDDGAHRFDLRAAKGAPPPPASIRSILRGEVPCPWSARPPWSAGDRWSRPDRPVARDFRLAAPASRNASRQPLKSAAVTASSRATISSGSPRRTRSTASPLRLAVMRRSRPGAATAPISEVSAPAAPPRSLSPISTPPSALICRLGCLVL